MSNEYSFPQNACEITLRFKKAYNYIYNSGAATQVIEQY